MNSNEILSQVLLGSHTKVKAFLAPVIEGIKAAFPDMKVGYNGSGGIFVEADSGRAEVLACAFKVQSDYPQMKVSKLWRFQSYQFAPVTNRFKITVRPA